MGLSGFTAEISENQVKSQYASCYMNEQTSKISPTYINLPCLECLIRCSIICSPPRLCLISCPQMCSSICRGIL